LKFEGEFDFEQANARFTEEIEKNMDKLKLDEASKKDSKKDSNKSDTEKDTSLSHSMSQQEMQDQAHIMMKQKSMEAMDMHREMSKHMESKMLSKEDQDMKDFYDKNISFFDRISCESNEKMMNQKPKNWKEERKINAETFGLVQKVSSYHRNYNYNNRNYNNPRNQYQRNYQNSNNQNLNSSRGNARDTQQRSQNYNQRSSANNQNGNMRSNNMNNNGYRRQEMEVNGNSQRRFGSR